MIDYSSLQLLDVFMHQVTKNVPGARPRFTTHLTDAPVNLADNDRSFLTRRFVRALTRGAVAVIESSGALLNPAPDEIRALWSGTTELSKVSKSLAGHLADCQPATALAGLLVIAEARLGPDECVLVAKVEHQEAMRINQVVNEDGNRVFELERLRDLVFADGTRIYKIAILSKAASSTGQLGGTLADEQNGSGHAAYYLQTFMGMKLREEPPVLTEQYLDRMTNVVNKSTMGPEHKIEVQMALLADLKSNVSDLDAHRFIRDFVPSDYQTQIRNLAGEAEVPLVRFPKDLTRVSSKLTRVRIDMSNDVYVIAPSDSVGEGKQVEVHESDAAGDADIVTITGVSIRNIKPNGSR